jgi:hypothetical protein
MTTALEKILESIKKFDAENATIGESDPPPSISKAQCYKTYRESMSALIKIWKTKVAALTAANDPNPQMTAANQMQTQFKNVQAALQKCLNIRQVKIKTPKPGDKWP